MKTVKILLAAIFLTTLVSCSPYYIDEGFDFATGENVIRKTVISTPPETIWIKRLPGSKAIYEKYQIGYPTPILFYYCGTEYNRWGVSGSVWDGGSPYGKLTYILEHFKPPMEDAKEMYSHCIKMYEQKADNKTVEIYLKERFDYYNDPTVKTLINKILANSGDTSMINEFRDNQSYITDYLKRHRNEYPAELDENFLELIQKCEYSWNRSDFFLFEYLYNPSPDNALRLGIRMCREDSCDSPFIAKAFKELEEKKLLEKFLSVTLPPDLPPLPAPVPEYMPHKINQATAGSFKGLPCREAALRFVVNSNIIESYLLEKQKKNKAVNE